VREQVPSPEPFYKTVWNSPKYNLCFKNQLSPFSRLDRVYVSVPVYIVHCVHINSNLLHTETVVTHAVGGIRVSIAIIRVRDSVCLSAR